MKTMRSNAPPKFYFKSVMAVLAGLAAVIILSTVTDAILQGINMQARESDELDGSRLLLATLYRCIYAVIGGYITARLAPARPMGLAVALGIVGLVLSIAGLVATWGIGHEWYPLSLVVTAVPCAWLGGKLNDAKPRAAVVA